MSVPRRWALALIPILALVLVLAAVGSAAPNPKGMVLRLSDMPAGFTFEKGRYVSNAQAAKEDTGVTLGDYVRWGRLTGYDATFTRGGLVTTLQVVSSASTYKTAQGARASLLKSFAAAAKAKYKPVSTGGPIGQEAHAYSTNVRQNGTTATVIVVVWRDATVKASLFAGGLKGTVNAADAIELARKQQARIATALR